MPAQIKPLGMTIKDMLGILIPGAGYLTAGVLAFGTLDTRISVNEAHLEPLEGLRGTVAVIQLAQDVQNSRLTKQEGSLSGMVTESGNTRNSLSVLETKVESVQDDVSEIKQDVKRFDEKLESFERGQREMLDILSGRQ